MSSSPSIVTAPPLVLPSPEARVKLPPLHVDEGPAIIEGAPQASKENSPDVTLNVPPLPMSEPTDTAILLPDSEADGSLPMFTAQLRPALAVLVRKDNSPDTTKVPVLLVGTDTFPKLVSVPAPDKILMDPPESPGHRHH